MKTQIENQAKFLNLKTTSDAYKVIYLDSDGKLSSKRFKLNQNGLQEANKFIASI